MVPKNEPTEEVKRLETDSSTSSSVRMVKVEDVANEPRVELKEEDCPGALASAFTSGKKWFILAIVAVIQTSMNFNAAVYSNAVEELNQAHNTSKARHGMIAFLVTYAFGCELWAPWSEEFGRFPIMQLSLGFVNLWQIQCAVSQNWSTVLAGRVLGGLSSAGGSVTLGMVADMWDSNNQQYAVAFVSLWSCLGSVIGGVLGGPIEQYLPWRWNFWIQLTFGIFVQVAHFIFVPETRSTIRIDREAKIRRTLPNYEGRVQAVWGPNEMVNFRERFSAKEILATMFRPYKMLLTEPIVLFLSLLSGFSDALIFSFLESYGYVFEQWHFSKSELGGGLGFLVFGYLGAYFAFFPLISKHNKFRRRHGSNALSPESRLYGLLFLVPLLPLGLLGFAFVSTGPPIPWIAPLLFSVLIGAANFAIYFATIDYMVAAYGEYAASATGGNGFMRDFLAGMCALYTKPLYKGLGTKNASFLLCGISVAVTIPVYIFYWAGRQVRARSKFALKLAAQKESRRGQVDLTNITSQSQGVEA